MKMFYNVFIANFKEFIRDKSALFWFLAFPIIFVFIFGIVFSGGGEQTFTVGVVQEDVNPVSEQTIKTLESIPTFNVKAGSSLAEEKTALENGKRSMVLVIPEIDPAKMMYGENYDIRLLYDAADQQTSRILISVIRQIFSEIERGISGAPKLFTVSTETVQAEQFSEFDYILPGILAMALMQLGLFGGLQFLTLREQGIIRGLGVTPLSRGALLSSEILLRLIMALVQTFIIILLGNTVFGVKFVGGLLQITGLVVLGSLTFISFGYMIVSFASSSESGQGIVQVVQFPMMFLSGIFFPVNMMPDYIKPVIKAIPLTYLGDALRQLMVGASADHAMQTNIIVLSVWLIVTLVMAMKFWKWE